MKASFMKEYMAGVIQGVLWVVIGALSMWLIQSNSETYMIISVLAADIALIAAGELGFTYLRSKWTPRANVQRAPRPENPLDQVPISAQKKGMPVMARISYVALIGERGNELLKWPLEGKTAIVIGKGTDTEPVDIDLSGSAMAQMISKQHAVLNYTDNGWYVDDIDSRNGTRVKKKNQSALLDVKLVGAVEVEAGDIIYIANAMLQVR